MKLMRALLVGSLVFAVVACGGSSTESDSDSGSLVETVVKDGSIAVGRSSVPTGGVSFEISNEGTIVHEVEVFAGSETDLPVDLGVADTTGLTLLDEVEDIIPGGNVNLNLDLDPGDYVIICNLPGHYQMGMVTSLTVTG